MITRERLSSTTYGRSLLTLYERLVPYNVTDWGNDDSGTKQDNRPGDREEVGDLMNANVITSLRKPDPNDPFADEVPDERHALVLDIDHPSWLMPSTTPGHFHLYVDVPGGISKTDYANLLDALANAGVIEPGYAGASKARGFTSVRFPWIEKEKGPKQHD